MAMNDRVEVLSGDVDYGQFAPSKANRTMFTPGKITSLPDDQNWPKDNRIPTSTTAFNGEAAGPVEMVRSRVSKLGRNIICDQTLPIPVILKTRLETRVEAGVVGASLVDDTELPRNVTDVEKKTGYDNIVGA